tara:strand:- start:235 stop:420 length:186 start_codon:yes stop_codon:yes gene_type:complete
MTDLSDYRDWLFRGLDAEEIEKFQRWAWDNYKPGEAIVSYWHPVVRRECERINEDNNGSDQ